MVEDLRLGMPQAVHSKQILAVEAYLNPFCKKPSIFSLLYYISFVRSICYPIQRAYNDITSLTLPCASHFILAKQNNSSNVKCRKSVKNELMIINKYV